MRIDSPASERNSQPIGEVLARYLPETGLLLEVASGGGYHAAFFARQFPGMTWQPTDISAEALESIRGWVGELGLPNLRQPLLLDASRDDWPVDRADVVMAVNVLHISPWKTALGLMAGACRTLDKGGLLFIYGPFNIEGRHTSEGNERFDASLRQRNSQWGIRDVEQVIAAAADVGLDLEERVPMPANNQSLVFRR